MDISTSSISTSSIAALPTYREERFRTPSRLESRVGLWVDRIGAASRCHEPIRRLRLLGQYAMVAIEKGAGRFVSSVAGSRVFRAGDVAILFPDMACAYTPDVQWESRWIVWNGPEALALVQLGFLRPRRPLASGAASLVSAAFDRLTPLMQEEGKASVLERKTVVLELIRLLYEHGAAAQASGPERAIRTAVTFVHENPAAGLSVPMLARQAHLSETHFRRLFKRYTGQRPREFITGVRISRAKALLARGVSIKQAARRCGYEDVFYFMRAFKKRVGEPPGRFAARHCTRSLRARSG